jgi:L-ascorbate metabolism protein UlaG (beta-lactamase superfamily)
MKLKYLSHSGFLIEYNEIRILIDPFLSGNPNAINSAEQIDAEYILLTHGHSDHIGDTIEIAKRCNSLVIAVNELGIYLSEFGLKVHKMHIGGSYKFPFGRVKFTIAHHGSSNSEGRYMGEPAGIVLSIDGKNIYHCGDTGLFYDMNLIGKLDKIDVMLVPIGGNFTMGIDDAVIAVDFVNPQLTIPIHYNTFPIIQADPNEFSDKVKSFGRNVKILNYGEVIEL